MSVHPRLLFVCAAFACVLSAAVLAADQPDSWTAWAANPTLPTPPAGEPSFTGATKSGGFGFYVGEAGRKAFLNGLAGAAIEVETFDNNIPPAASLAICNEPIFAGSSDACFGPGMVRPGLEVETVDSVHPNPNLALLTAGFFGGTSDRVGANWFADGTRLVFPGSGVKAVGADILAPLGNGFVDLTYYGNGGVPLGGGTISNLGTGAFFVGLVLPVHIARVEIVGQANGGELVDNVYFGAYSVLEIPTLSTYGLGAFALLLATASVVLLRRRPA